MQVASAFNRVKVADAQRLEDLQNNEPERSAAPEQKLPIPWGLYVGGAVALTVVGVGLYVVLRKND
jgi:cytochrome c-type biogenesis protein CcmH/NrfG